MKPVVTPSQWVAALHWAQNATAWYGLVEQRMDGRAVVQHELTWLGKTPKTAADDIHKLLRSLSPTGHPEDPLIVEYTVLDYKRFARPDDIGESVAESFQNYGIDVQESHHDRVAGFSRLRSWFDLLDWRTTNAEGELVIERGPGLRISRRCSHLLRTLPTLMSDGLNPDDIEETVDEYAVRALSYWAMSRPAPATPIEIEPPADAIYHDVQQLRREAARRD